MALATNLPAFLTDAGKRGFYKHKVVACPPSTTAPATSPQA
jgi:hypothetical protein